MESDQPSIRTTGMHLAVIGSGYVGTTLGACMADIGHRVTTVDIDEEVVNTLNAGEAPIHEPGLAPLIASNAGDRLTATTDYADIATADLIFVAVQTPSREDGSIDVSALSAAVRQAANTLVQQGKRDDGYVIVIKSTVTPPHLRDLSRIVEEVAAESDFEIELASNPEFLREGTAVTDFNKPDKIVFGAQSDSAADRLYEAFDPIIQSADPHVIITDPETASMIKYANNAFLAAKISLINDIGNICKEFGIDAYEVAEAIGTDARIGAQFLRSGVGFGGSCFPKDVRAIYAAGADAGYGSPMLEATLEVNDIQPARLLALLEKHVDPDGTRIAVLGLAFKPGTDDIRESRAIPVIEGLQKRGAEVVAYDPVAIDAMRARFPEIAYATSAADALEGAEAAVVVTDWDEFAALDEAFDRMSRPVVIDGRRIVQRRDGITYEGITW